MEKLKWKPAICVATILTLTAVWTGYVSAATNPVVSWSAIASQATLMSGQSPPVASRTLAIVQAAVHDALNAIDSRYERYAYTGIAPAGASMEAAIATAAHDAAVRAIAVGPLSFAGFGTPAQQNAAVALLDSQYAAALGNIPAGISKDDGVTVGQAAAEAIRALRQYDHATDFVPYTPGTQPGEWQPTPNPVPFDPPAPADHLPALMPGWGHVTPFVLRRSTQFEPAGPPRLSGPTYAQDYNEIMAIGQKNSITRTADQSSIARFWYEASAIGWSRIGRIVSESQGLDSWQTARLLALANLSMADAYIGGFEAKYEFNFWRPVTAIRAGDTDGNDRTVADPSWTSFLNTPPLPDYTSTHSVAGGAVSEVLRRFFRTDNVSFTMTSGPPFVSTRAFTGFSHAATENGESRIYAGIHFRTAVEDGIKEGEQIGSFVFTHALLPLDPDEVDE